MSEPTFDPTDWRFWTCGNWPYGRAPARWEAVHSPPHPTITDWPYCVDDYYPSATLYVPQHVGDEIGDPWGMATFGSHTHEEAMRKAMQLARELEAERDEYLAGLLDLHAVQQTSMAMVA